MSGEGVAEAKAKLVGQSWSRRPVSMLKAQAGVVGARITRTRNAPFAIMATAIHNTKTEKTNSFGQALDANDKIVEAGKGEQTSVGKERQARAKDAANKAHATHELDAKAQEIFKESGDHDYKNKKWKDLEPAQQKAAKEKIDKDVISMDINRKPYNSKLTAAQITAVDARRVAGDPEGEFSAAASLSQQRVHATRGTHLHTAKDITEASKADIAVGEFITALKKGSMDVRNLSGIKSNAGGLAGLSTKIIAGVALGTRMGLKQMAGVDHGKGEKDIWKDLGNTLKTAISDGFKVASVKVDLPKSVHKEDDHGHGGGGGHH